MLAVVGIAEHGQSIWSSERESDWPKVPEHVGSRAGTCSFCHIVHSAISFFDVFEDPFEFSNYGILSGV